MSSLAQRQATFPLAAGAVSGALGASVLVSLWIGAALAVVGSVVLLAPSRPAAVVPLVFASILLESFGQLDVSAMGIPLTLSKLSVLLATTVAAIDIARSRMGDANTPWLPIAAGGVAVVITMVGSLGVAEQIQVSEGLHPIIGVISLLVLVHLLVRLIPPQWAAWSAPGDGPHHRQRARGVHADGEPSRVRL